MKQTFLIKDTKTGRVLDTLVGFMADAIEYMAERSDLRDHAGIFPQDVVTTKA